MLIEALIVMAQLGAGEMISSSMESFRALSTYSVTLESTSDGTVEVIRYYYRKPGYVRMEFVTPHRGAVLVYDPARGKARLRPFGFFKPLVLTLSPDSALITSSAGHTVDRSHVGALLEDVLSLAHSGSAEVRGSEEVGGRPAYLVEVRGGGGRTVEGTNMYLLDLDRETLLPLRVRAYGPGGGMTQDVLMADLAIDPVLPDGLFVLK
ncbi:MAG: outer membrane lipoprotein carrier protein LolA [Thermodesulfobacteriota bacterium]